MGNTSSKKENDQKHEVSLVYTICLSIKPHTDSSSVISRSATGVVSRMLEAHRTSRTKARVKTYVSSDRKKVKIQLTNLWGFGKPSANVVADMLMDVIVHSARSGGFPVASDGNRDAFEIGTNNYVTIGRYRTTIDTANIDKFYAYLKSSEPEKSARKSRENTKMVGRDGRVWTACGKQPSLRVWVS